jgi:tripartite ATP-independent transporter DctP family solute receptor
VIEKCGDHGFRQITTKSKPINTPDDLKGFKIRLPVSPYLIALFQHLGASPTPINFGEVYSALQTGLVDGQENPLILIDTAKLYEVQKFCSITNHVWAGIHYSFSNIAWKRLPADLQELATKRFNEAAMVEREDWQKMTKEETENLTKKGLTFNTPDTAPFREQLKKNGFYPEMKKKSGDKGWALLEQSVGPLT